MWFEQAVVYQIYPLGLCGAPAENDGRLEHRILRLVDWAEHIRSLGADTVLLNPVFDSDRHGYDTRDYFHLDPRLGTDDDLAQGINLLYFLPAALLALPAHRKNGYLDTKALPWLIGSGLICAALAAWLSAGLEVTLLRKLFGAFLIVIGLHEIFSKVRKDE